MSSNKHIERAFRRRVTVGVLFLLACTVTAYIYFLSFSIIHVVARTAVEEDIATYKSRISMLESQYIDTRYALGEAALKSDTYHTVRDKYFIDTTTTALAFE